MEWRFSAIGTNDAKGAKGTFVSVTESGWTGTGDELVGYALDSSQGFTWVLAGAKALLEHGIELNLVPDRFPNGPQDPYPDQ